MTTDSNTIDSAFSFDYLRRFIWNIYLIFLSKQQVVDKDTMPHSLNPFL